MCMSCVTKGVSVRWIFVVKMRRRRARATPRPRRAWQGEPPDDRGRRTGRRARDRPGPRLTLRDRLAPLIQRYHERLQRPSGLRGHRRRRADIRPGDGGGELSGRNNNKSGACSLGKREKYVEKICRENMRPAPGRSRTRRPGGGPAGGRLRPIRDAPRHRGSPGPS